MAFNTLAQTGTSFKPQKVSKPTVIVSGKGLEMVDTDAVKKRVKRKTVSQFLVLNLIKTAEQKGDKDILKPLWNTFYCQSTLVSTNGKLYAHYCKNHFCTVCSANRKAEMINKYRPVVYSWPDPCFVTLTHKSVPKEQLVATIDAMERVLHRIIEKYKKRNQRGTDIKLIGIKSLECNFNPIKLWYNPHFHILVPDLETALILQSEWMKAWGKEIAGQGGQKVNRVRDLEHQLTETIKYTAKVFTDPDMKKGKACKADPVVYAAAIYNIIKAMYGRRVFDRFGFNLPAKALPTANCKEVTEYDEFVFDNKKCTYLNTETDEPLLDCLPPHDLIALLTTGMNTKIQ